MGTRRSFIKKSTLLSALALTGLPKITKALTEENFSGSGEVRKPVVISTWNHGLAANADAWKILSSNGTALDAVEKGVMNSEADFSNLSVGLGGLPDRDGNVT